MDQNDSIIVLQNDDSNGPFVKYLSNRHSLIIEKLSREKLEFDWLVFMCDGEVSYFIDDEPITLSAGNALYAPMGCYRERMEQRGPAHYISIHIINDSESAKSINRVFRFADSKKLNATLDMLVNEYLSASKPNTDANNVLLKRIISCCEEICGAEALNIKVHQMMDFIRNNINRQISTYDVAQCMNMTTSYCNALFKDYCGTTIGQYISHIRLEQAKSELRNTSHKISHIAANVGFSDEFYFSRWFKKQTGMAPGQYRSMS